MKRIFDIFLVIICSILFLFPILIIILCLFISSSDSVIFWSDRIGRNNLIFKMPKFRTMDKSTPNVATNLLDDPQNFVTPIGSILRKTSLDELPQLWSILKGDMSFVGPRPALFNQYDLIKLRTKNGVDKMLPGLTGWAQINGRDDLSTHQKVKYDIEYLNRQSFIFDITILITTLIKTIKRHNVSH